ncbi:unnamed protein product [Parnassius mnemosyne]|uniref:Uncharacterized protein n=1 Tax=Parnassius mnemosyne TaxID=213953 RepID=A0AAV1KMG4_9NEOP
MGLPQLETCCFVFDLKTGNTIMGCLNAVMSLTIFIIMAVVAATLEPIQEAAFEEKDLEKEAAMTGLYVMSILLVVMFFAKFCFDVVFVYGVVTERAGIVRTYFFMWAVFFFLSLFTFFVNVTHYNAGTICVEVFYICLNVYAILLSNSFYKQLNSREVV